MLGYLIAIVVLLWYSLLKVKTRYSFTYIQGGYYIQSEATVSRPLSYDVLSKVMEERHKDRGQVAILSIHKVCNVYSYCLPWNRG